MSRSLPQSRAVPLLRALFLVLLLTCAGACGCSSNGGTTPRTDAARIAVVASSVGLSPLLDRGQDAVDVQGALFRGLLTWNADGVHQPGWAEAVPSATNRTFRPMGLGMAEYTFTLRQDACWGDGQPLSSNDFMFSYRMAVHPLFRKSHAHWTAYLEQFEMSGARNLQLTVHRSSTRDVVDFLPLPAHLLEATLGDPTGFADLPYHQQPVGNGPFKMAGRSDTVIKMDASEHYAPAHPTLEHLQFQLYPSAEEAMQALEKGEVDVMPRLPADRTQAWRSHPPAGIDLEARAAERLALLVFNTQNPLLENVAVRRALTRAIDRKKVAAQGAGGNGVFTDSWIQPWSAGYVAACSGLAFDRSRAQRELKASGWEIDGEGHLRSGESTEAITVLYDAERSDLQGIVLALREAWKALGLTVGLEPRDHDSYDERLRKGDFCVALQEVDVMPWTQPAFFLAKDSIPIPRNSFRGLNVSRWSNPRHDRLLQKIAGVEAPTAAMALLKEQQRMLASQVPVVPLFFNVRVSAHRKGLDGVRDRGFGDITWNVEQWRWK